MESRMIYICSPYAGNTEENVAFADRHAVMPSGRERFLWHPTCYIHRY